MRIRSKVEVLLEDQRKALGFSQDDVGEIIGTSRTYRNRLKKPDTFTIRELRAVAKFLRLNNAQISALSRYILGGESGQ